MKVLINTLGISDSGGISVLEKLIQELAESNSNDKFYFTINNNPLLINLIKNYQNQNKFDFRIVANKNYLYRFFYENYLFRKIIKKNGIDLIYNFSGTTQFFLSPPQIIKIHNLLFYCQKLDKNYFAQSKYFLWFKQVFFKAFVYRLMLKKSSHLEIQSNHVREYLSDFINIKSKSFYIKSDINSLNESFSLPKNYDFSKKIKILYIVGPHFEYLHKNFKDFVNAMNEMNKTEINFEINITLTKKQLNNSGIWNQSLNAKTNFHGYINDRKVIKDLFIDNTILISTSIIETLGLHVIEGIKYGIVTIVPNEHYARSVYGNEMFKYELFNHDSIIDTIESIIKCKDIHDKVLGQQDYLKKIENQKYQSILQVFNEVLNVQK